MHIREDRAEIRRSQIDVCAGNLQSIVVKHLAKVGHRVLAEASRLYFAVADVM